MSFKVKMIYPDGVEDFLDEIYDTEDDAIEGGNYAVSCCRVGAETLHWSNPGDYDYDEETYQDPDYEVIDEDGWVCFSSDN